MSLRKLNALGRLAIATGAEPSEERYELYMEELALYTDDQVELAASVLVKESRFFPSVAEFVKAMVAPERQPMRMLPAPGTYEDFEHKTKEDVCNRLDAGDDVCIDWWNPPWSKAEWRKDD